MQLAYLEKSAEKRRVFANRANEEPALSEIQKKRIRCMFALDYEKDALQQLESLYDDTKEVHDLINLIRYSGIPSMQLHDKDLLSLINPMVP